MTALPTHAAGIDIGKASLHLATGYTRADDVVRIDVADPLWHVRLTALIPAGATVALEPTGWHYSQPVMRTLQAHGARILIVEHSQTAHVRELNLSGVKNDRTDARALAYIAAHHAQAQFLKVHEGRPDEEGATAALRLIIYAHRRANREFARATNRIRALAHSIWPLLEQELTLYTRCLEAGAATPRQLRILAEHVAAYHNGELPHKQAWEACPPFFRTDGRAQKLRDLIAALPAWLENDNIAPALFAEHAARAHFKAEAEQLGQLVAEAVDQPPFKRLTNLWLTVPFAGRVPIATIHAATHAQADRLTPAQFRAAIGHHPARTESGETAISRASRAGFAPAKAAIHLWAMSLIKQGDNPIAVAFRRARDAGHTRPLSLAKSKLLNILSGIARSGQPYDPNHAMKDGAK
jgi:transposase